MSKKSYEEGKKKISLKSMLHDLSGDSLNFSIKKTIKVGKADKQKFYRVKPGDENSFSTLVIEDKTEGSSNDYLISPNLVSKIKDETIAVIFHLAISRVGDLLLWRSRLPNKSGKLDTWNRSSLRMKEIAEKSWIRVLSNKNHNCYEAMIAKSFLEEPVWPEEPLEELVNDAFKDHYIDYLDHPVLKKLRGEH